MSWMTWGHAAILWFLPGAPIIFFLSDLLFHSTDITGAVILVWGLIWAFLIYGAYQESHPTKRT